MTEETNYSKPDHKDIIEVTILEDIYLGNADNDDCVLIKKDAKSKQTFFKKDINHVKQVLNTSGNIRTKRVELGIAYKDSIIVEGSYKAMQQLLFNNKPVDRTVGFKFY